MQINQVRLAAIIATLFFYLIVWACLNVHAKELTASWYSVESCEKESGQHTMANGRELDDKKFTAASWDYPFGTIVKVTNLENKKSVTVEICDRGPSRKMYRQGRVIDLSRIAFKRIGELGDGILKIKIEEIK